MLSRVRFGSLKSISEESSGNHFRTRKQETRPVSYLESTLVKQVWDLAQTENLKKYLLHKKGTQAGNFDR